MRSTGFLLALAAVVAAGAGSARAALLPHHAARIYIGKHSALKNRDGGTDFLADAISGRVAALLDGQGTRNAQDCARCAVVVQ